MKKKSTPVIAHQILAAAKIIVEQLTSLGYDDEFAAIEYVRLKIVSFNSLSDKTDCGLWGAILTIGEAMPKQKIAPDLSTPCTHYCSVGGHLWEHDVKRDKNGISDCSFIIHDAGYKTPVVKFLIPCLRHTNV